MGSPGTPDGPMGLEARNLSPEPVRHRLCSMRVACMSVGLKGRSQASMPEHALHANRGRAVREHLSCCRVAQHVGCHVTNPTPSAVQGHGAPHCAGVQRRT